MIGQALPTFIKPGTHGECAIYSNLIGYELFYVRSGIEYRKVGFCEENVNIYFDMRRIITVSN